MSVGLGRNRQQARRPKGHPGGGQFAPSAKPTTPETHIGFQERETTHDTTVMAAEPGAGIECKNGGWVVRPDWETSRIGVQTAMLSRSGEDSRLYWHQAASAVVWSEAIARSLNRGEIQREDAELLVPRLARFGDDRPDGRTARTQRTPWAGMGRSAVAAISGGGGWDLYRREEQAALSLIVTLAAEEVRRAVEAGEAAASEVLVGVREVGASLVPPGGPFGERVPLDESWRSTVAATANGGLHDDASSGAFDIDAMTTAAFDIDAMTTAEFARRTGIGERFGGVGMLATLYERVTANGLPPEAMHYKSAADPASAALVLMSKAQASQGDSDGLSRWIVAHTDADPLLTNEQTLALVAGFLCRGEASEEHRSDSLTAGTLWVAMAKQGAVSPLAMVRAMHDACAYDDGRHYSGGVRVTATTRRQRMTAGQEALTAQGKDGRHLWSRLHHKWKMSWPLEG